MYKRCGFLLLLSIFAYEINTISPETLSYSSSENSPAISLKSSREETETSTVAWDQSGKFNSSKELVQSQKNGEKNITKIVKSIEKHEEEEKEVEKEESNEMDEDEKVMQSTKYLFKTPIAWIVLATITILFIICSSVTACVYIKYKHIERKISIANSLATFQTSHELPPPHHLLSESNPLHKV